MSSIPMSECDRCNNGYYYNQYDPSDGTARLGRAVYLWAAMAAAVHHERCTRGSSVIIPFNDAEPPWFGGRERPAAAAWEYEP